MPVKGWKRDVLDQLEGKLLVGDGCWYWDGCHSTGGYPTTKNRKVATIVYELMVGPVPPGLHLDHLCHTNDPTCTGGRGCAHRRCVRPSHLEPVTPRENALRGRTITAAHAAKTHCPHGHPYDENNTYIIPSTGSRACRACQVDHRRRSSERKAMSD